MYTLRYVDGTDLNDRKHQFTKAKGSFEEVEEALQNVPDYFRDKLEIVQR
jgi:hypothetical protein